MRPLSVFGRLMTILALSCAVHTAVSAMPAQADPPAAIQTAGTIRAPYTAPDGSFSILLPQGFPQFQQTQEDTGSAAGVMTQYLSVSDGGVCAIFYNDFEPGVFTTLKEDEIIRAGSEGITQDPGVKLIEQQDYPWSGRMRRTVKLEETEEGKKVYTQVDFVVDKPRLYQLYYSSPEQANLNQPDVMQFFNSFLIK